MPLTKRAVSPVNVSRNVIPAAIHRDELQCTANGTIANLIRQLSSLSKHAENIFGEIYHDAMIIYHKTNTLQQRIDRLQSKVTQVDASNDSASINEANMRKAFKSSMLVDHHILDRTTLPAALSERYERCDAPPDLDNLNPYRDSDVPALSLYTNPSFFFDLWKKETLKDVTERQRRVKSPGDGSKSPKKRRRQPQAQHNISEQSAPYQQQPTPDIQKQRGNRYNYNTNNHQNDIFSFPEEYQAPQALGLQLNFKNQTQHNRSHNIIPPMGMSIHNQPHQPSSLVSNKIPLLSHSNGQSPGMNRPINAGSSISNPHKGSPAFKPKDNEPVKTSNLDNLPPPDMSLLSIDDEDDELPPPPPPLNMHASIVHQLPTEQPTAIQFVEPSNEPANIPPPPPPPPPLPANLVKPTSSATFARANEDSKPNETETKPKNDARSDLLAQIQSGIKLKKVRLAEDAAAEKAALEKNDVAAILKRRMDQVLGNDDEDTSSEDYEDDEWDD